MADLPYWQQQLLDRLDSTKKLASTVDITAVEPSDALILDNQIRLLEYLCTQLQPLTPEQLDDPAILGEKDAVITKLILELKKAQEDALVAQAALAKSQQLLKEVQARDAGNARKAATLNQQLMSWKDYATQLEGCLFVANQALAKFKQPAVPRPVPPEIRPGTLVVKDAAGHIQPASGGPYISGSGPRVGI